MSLLTCLYQNDTPLWRGVATLALASAGAAASAAPLPSFTFDPAAVGLSGGGFSGNNLLISDFSTISNTGTAFTSTGFLSISAVQNATGTFSPTGLNSDYGLYFSFTGSGTLTLPGNPTSQVTTGSFDNLAFTLYGYNGAATFGFAGNTPTTTAAAPIALATGSLFYGSVVTVPNGDGTFTPSASAKMTFSVLQPAFFASPNAFYDLASTSFSNTASEVETFSNGFRIRQGGGSINFSSSPVPEPSSYAMLMVGLGVVGFLAHRRRPGRGTMAR